MQETSRYAVGIDIGTTKTRCVIGYVDDSSGSTTIVGVGEASNSGMRKGSIVSLQGPFKSIDSALNEAERMSGYHVEAASVSINGSHIISTRADGMIAVGEPDHEIDDSDVERLTDVATTGKNLANREILEVIPFSYSLDGQKGIKAPIGMTGTRLEINANIISALAPQYNNLNRVMSELDDLQLNAIEPSVMAAGRAVLTEQQLENGVAVIDFGGATTSLAIYEEGDLQYLSVIPVGGNNITNDLAIGLMTDPDVAEDVKLQHGSAIEHENKGKVSIKRDKETIEFSIDEIDEIIEARLEEIFEAINKELKKAGKKGKLPSGVVIVGGGAKLKNMVDCTKNKVELATKLGKFDNEFGGATEKMKDSSYAAVVGLMLKDMQNTNTSGGVNGGHGSVENKKNSILKFFDRFKP